MPTFRQLLASELLPDIKLVLSRVVKHLPEGKPQSIDREVLDGDEAVKQLFVVNLRVTSAPVIFIEYLARTSSDVLSVHFFNDIFCLFLVKKERFD